MTSFCGKCGTALQPDAKFCAGCGAANLSARPLAQVPPPAAKSKISGFRFLLIALMVIVLFGLGYRVKKSAEAYMQLSARYAIPQSLQ